MLEASFLEIGKTSLDEPSKIDLALAITSSFPEVCHEPLNHSNGVWIQGSPHFEKLEEAPTKIQYQEGIGIRTKDLTVLVLWRDLYCCFTSANGSVSIR